MTDISDNSFFNEFDKASTLQPFIKVLIHLAIIQTIQLDSENFYVESKQKITHNTPVINLLFKSHVKSFDDLLIRCNLQCVQSFLKEHSLIIIGLNFHKNFCNIDNTVL